MIKHLDLFSGVGGFALAAQMVGGIQTKQFVEIDPYCQKVLAKNFSGIPIHNDVRTFTAQPGDFDLITGGFPCQPHSEAGKRKASQDERDLWPELYRVICEVQPRWVVLENVRGLLSSEAGRFFRGVLWDLARAGFDAEWSIIPASDMGAAHRRERVWIVAYAQHHGSHETSQSGRIESGKKKGRMQEPQGCPISRHAPNSTGKGLEKSIKAGEWSNSTQARTGVESEPTRSIADAPKPNSKRLEAWQFPPIREAEIAKLKQLNGSNGRGFTTEPGFCECNDGLPCGMARCLTPEKDTMMGNAKLTNHASESGQSARQDLSCLQKRIQSESVQWHAGRLDAIQEADLLQHGLFGGCSSVGVPNGFSASQTSANSGQEQQNGEELHPLWYKEFSSNSPQRRESSEQLCLKLDDIVCVLSPEAPLAGWLARCEATIGLLNLWEACQISQALPETPSEVQKAWQSFSREDQKGIIVSALINSRSNISCLMQSEDLPYWGSYALLSKSDSTPNRVDRIRGLGNAVVPQVAAIPLQRVLQLAQSIS